MARSTEGRWCFVVLETPNPSCSPGCSPRAPLVAFEVDDVDMELHQAWRVLMGGHVGLAESRQKEADRLEEVRTPRPWVGGDREKLVRITPVEVIGRRIARTVASDPNMFAT
jgi:hypothetical protein